jgi:mannose-6-phosphate isomerase-like protein (cupin superfamily)
MITFGTTKGAPWVEAISNDAHPFTGRTFSRFHLVHRDGRGPNVGEIWATADHVVEAHAHGTDELLYVLSGAVMIDGRRLEAGEVAWIRAGTAYGARVLSAGGSHVLRIELPTPNASPEAAEYEAEVWRGPVTATGLPDPAP